MKNFGRFTCLVLALTLVCTMAFGTLTVSAEEEATQETLVKRLEAEDAQGSYLIGEGEDASEGAFIAMDMTFAEGTKEPHYYLEFQNMPATTRIVMTYVTAWSAHDVIAYVKTADDVKMVGGFTIAPSGGWEMISDFMAEAEMEAYIPEGSTLILHSNGSTNIDCFDLYYDATSPLVNREGKQEETVKDQQNAFISDLAWMSPAPETLEWVALAERDATVLYGTLEVAGQDFTKGVGMLSGHYTDASRIDVNVEDLGFTTFAAYVGVAADTMQPFTNEPASVIFSVKADGVEVARSEVMEIDDEAVLLKADITGASVLSLCVSPADDSCGTDGAVWGMAAIGKTDNEADLFATPVPATPTPVPEGTEGPEATNTPGASNAPNTTKAPSGNSDTEEASFSIWIPVAAVAALVVIAVVVVILVKKKKA